MNSSYVVILFIVPDITIYVINLVFVLLFAAQIDRENRRLYSDYQLPLSFSFNYTKLGLFHVAFHPFSVGTGRKKVKDALGNLYNGFSSSLGSVRRIRIQYQNIKTKLRIHL